MILYIEGPDGSGKSTLTRRAKWNCGNLSIPYELAEPSIQTNPKRPNRISEKELLLKLYAMLKDDKKLYILDRGPISDCIYRLFDEYEPVMQLDDIVDLFSRYRDKILIVYCNNADAEQYMLERGDDNPVALEKHHKISSAYDMIMPLLYTKLRYLKYDFTQEPQGQTERNVRAWMREVFNRGKE